MTSENVFEASSKRVGGGYRIANRGLVWKPPDLDNRPVFTAEEQAKTIAARKKRLTKHDEALLRASIAGDEMGAQLALRNGARVNCVDETGQTALVKAARHNNKDIVRCLLKEKADINKGDAQGWSPLFWASRMGSVNCVRELMNPTNKDGTPNRDIKGCDYGARSKTESRVHDIADSKVTRVLLEARKERGGDTKDDATADEDESSAVHSAAKPKKATRNAIRNVRKVRTTLMNAWGQHSLSPKPKARPRSAPVPAPGGGATLVKQRKGSICAPIDMDPRELSPAQKEKRLQRLIKDASSSIQGYMEIKEHGRVHPSTRLDHRKRDLVLREGLMKEMVRNSPDPTVYSLIWKYETHGSRAFNDRVIFRNWAEM